MKVGTRFYIGLFLVLLVVFPCHLQARIYKWFDAEGKVHYSQAPPPKGSIQTSIDGDTFSTIKSQKVPVYKPIAKKKRYKRTTTRRSRGSCPNR